jgi:hypothetical protein
MGLREDGGSYSLGDDEPVVDINTYTYVRGYYEQAMPLLVAGFGYCSKSFNARRAYCLYESRVMSFVQVGILKGVDAGRRAHPACGIHVAGVGGRGQVVDDDTCFVGCNQVRPLQELYPGFNFDDE